MYMYLVLLICQVHLNHGSEPYNKTLSIPLNIFNGTIRYACTSERIDAEQYIVKFIPNVEDGAVHHMSMAICEEPFENNDYWSCFDPKRVCVGKRETLFAMDSYAKPWELQKDIGIFTGRKPKYLLLQIHGYFKPKENSHRGSASMTITMTKERRKYDHAIHVNVNNGYIPATSGVFKAESACKWPHAYSVPIFSFSLHTHKYGFAVAGYIIRKGKWIEIGRGNPHYPRVIYDLTDQGLRFEPGDIIAARCSYDNYENRIIKYGFGEENEMCTYDVHYGVPHDTPQEDRVVVCSGKSPIFKWNAYFKNIPVTASDTSGNTVQNRYLIKHNVNRIQYE